MYRCIKLPCRPGQAEAKALQQLSELDQAKLASQNVTQTKGSVNEVFPQKVNICSESSSPHYTGKWCNAVA